MQLTERQIRHRKYLEAYRKNNREFILKLQKAYRQTHQERIKKEAALWRDKYYFNGLRKQVLERDNYTCQVCGMTNEEHKSKWNSEITIDHIDGNGRYSKTQNNTLENLQTLCFSCHGRKDKLRGLGKGKIV